MAFSKQLSERVLEQSFVIRKIKMKYSSNNELPNIEALDQVILYKLERAIKAYRQFAQRELRQAGFSITIDQWLTIKNISEHPGIKQNDLAERVFKDNASITRIVDLLVKAGYLERSIHKDDRRRAALTVTPKGLEIIEEVEEIVKRNRQKALLGISEEELRSLANTVRTITGNCKIS